MGVHWIITDVDGCLTPEESVPWEIDGMMRLARLSREASACGGGPLGRGRCAPLTLCTGRPQPYAEALMKLLDVRAPAICESGAVIYTLPDNRARFGPGVTPEKIAGLRAVRRFIESDLLAAFPDAYIQFGKEAQLSVFSKDPTIFAPLQIGIEEFLSREHLPALDMSASHCYLNISLAGVDKGAALRQVLRELRVEKHEVAGIGDTIGDLALADAVGYFACPANSVDAIKSRADYVSPYPMLEGVLDILARSEFQRA